MSAAGRDPRGFLSGSPEATEELAARLGALLPEGSVVALDGDLGAGKTCFVRGLARGLGIAEPVSSPTFTLMHEYRAEDPDGRALRHFDAWMAGREEAFLADGGADELGADGVAAVEWAERVADWLPAQRLEARLEHAGPEERRLTLRVRGVGGLADVLEGVLAALEPPPGVRAEAVNPPGARPLDGAS